MNKKQVFRIAAVLVSAAALASAQSTTIGPAAGLWALGRILLDCVGAGATIAFIYHAIMGYFVDRDHFHKLTMCALFAAFGFAAYPIMQLIQSATITRF